jgi:pimeloyl-ACP methyl ester carboxylesterase
LFAGLAPHFHVVAPDLPGFGLTRDITLCPPLGTQAVHVLDALLAALELPRISVLGTSFGGLAGLRLAQHFPERVERLVLLDSAGLARGMPWPVWLGTRPAVAGRALRPREAGSRWLLRRWLTSSRLEPEHEQALVAWLTAVGRAHTNQALRLFAGWRGQREVLSAAELRALEVPVLVLWGERDRFFPLAQAAGAVRHLADGRLHVLPAVGHSPNWECPDEVVVEVRRFLAEQQ